MRVSKKIKYWLPVLLWIIFIFWMSTSMFSASNTYYYIEKLLRFVFTAVSQKEILVFHNILRKLAHVTEYFISGLLLFRAFRYGSDTEREWRWALLSLAIVAVIAASDEFHQTFVASRTDSFVDIGIDILGGALAQGMNILLFKRKHKVRDN